MGLYSALTDDELAAKITAYMAARDALLIPGDGVGTVRKISDSDRHVEYFPGDLDKLDYELNRLLRERERRQCHGSGGQAIAVEFD